jgi:ABC-type uncharacterized transport system substrate-binding protein
MTVFRANTDQEIDAAFEAIARQRVPALVVGASPFFDTRRKKLVALAARNAVSAIYHYADDGGLMSYGLNFVDVYRLVGVYTGKVLKGAKPSELPVMQATKFEFVINLKTAKALGVLRQFALTRRRGDRVNEVNDRLWREASERQCLEAMSAFGSCGRSWIRAGIAGTK